MAEEDAARTNNAMLAKSLGTPENQGVIHALLDIGEAIDANTQEVRELRELIDGMARAPKGKDG